MKNAAITIATIDAQEQLATFIADAIPERILTFKFSAPIQRRIEQLVNLKKQGKLSETELENYLLYDYLIGLAKARASMRIAEK